MKAKNESHMHPPRTTISIRNDPCLSDFHLGFFEYGENSGCESASIPKHLLLLLLFLPSFHVLRNFRAGGSEPSISPPFDRFNYSKLGFREDKRQALGVQNLHISLHTQKDFKEDEYGHLFVGISFMRWVKVTV